jgi:hypothetical protein
LAGKGISAPERADDGRDIRPRQARQGNPSPFMTGLSKLIPHQVDAKVDASIIVEVVKFTDATPNA